MKQEPRALCIGDNNRCTNLATLREIRNGKRRYRNLCDSHRRAGRGTAEQRVSPNSKRYIKLDGCILCIAPATERHRIIPRSEYSAKSVVGLCANCHRKLHKFYDELKAKGYEITLV